MNKDKQVEELGFIIQENAPLSTISSQDLAEVILEDGYRKQIEGEWILTGTFKSTFPLPVADLYKACSVCRWSPPKYSADYKEYKFCPNCGAKMKGGAE